ncbi:hypothetical protein C7459_106245 [Tumebacillus permanentifrigoris]|uniref:Uncharacterized protein n=1 Tax=Tumebacillus permanentifrigoris TaxID=378543 RepID=A0A316DA12_9BACL|nr:hypothetical protein C7459_106245 [Tumebacillus permanentifrigoris]
MVAGESYTEIAQELGYKHHEQVRRIHKRLKKLFAEDWTL